VTVDATSMLLVALVLLLLTLLIGLARTIIGPSLQDRMLSVQLLGTGGVAVLLLMAALFRASALLDVALVLALLAVVAVAALTRRGENDD
jgi:multicomponent Na+:H+ antiporter subunit F